MANGTIRSERSDDPGAKPEAPWRRTGGVRNVGPIVSGQAIRYRPDQVRPGCDPGVFRASIPVAVEGRKRAAAVGGGGRKREAAVAAREAEAEARKRKPRKRVVEARAEAEAEWLVGGPAEAKQEVGSGGWEAEACGGWKRAAVSVRSNTGPTVPDRATGYRAVPIR